MRKTIRDYCKGVEGEWKRLEFKIRVLNNNKEFSNEGAVILKEK